MRLSGKTALITGGTSGIGAATAERLLQEGARVFVTGRNPHKLGQIKEQLGDKLTTIQADIRSLDGVRAMSNQVQEAVGPQGLDIYFANAGVAFSTPLATTDSDRFDELMAVNVRGLFFSMQALLPVLKNGGSVILNSAWLNTVGMAGFSALAATKSAVRSFARSWSCELLDRRIRVNVVSPGAIDTPIFELEGLPPGELADAKRKLSLRIPLGRMGAAEEIANAVVFLASDESSYMLGAELVVDGGFSQL